MSSYTGMFKLPPYYNFDQAELNLPDCMFKMSSYQSKEKDDDSAGDPRLMALEQRQTNILTDLQCLETEVAALSRKIHPTGQEVAAKTQAARNTSTSGSLGSRCLHDVVICANPSSPPHSLLILYEQLQQQLPCTARVHLHSSVSSVPDALHQFFSHNGAPMLNRGEAQLALTLIWKNVTQGPEMRINANQATPIRGEVNILRYLSRLLTPAYDVADIISVTSIDNFLDLASTSVLNGNNKERAAAVRTLNSALGKHSWLVGDSLTVADVALWSALQQTGLTSGAPSNVQKWLKACAARNEFRTALSAIA